MNSRIFDRPRSPLPAPAYSPWKPYRALVLVVVFYLVGTTWAKQMGWGVANLDLPLCCSLCLALMGGWEIGAWAGGIAGVLMMWTTWQNPGSVLFSHVLPPVLVGLLASRVPPLYPLAPPIAGIIGALIADCAFLLLSPRAMPTSFWLSHMPRFALVQALAMWPVMLCVARVAKRRKRLLFG